MTSLNRKPDRNAARNKIELWGRLLNQPELRTTPGGTALVRLQMDCAEAGEQLRLEVVMAGEEAREVARRLRVGQKLYVSGRLRAVGPAVKSGLKHSPVEVLASEIRPAAES